jgi:hypothetical protein
MVAAVEVWPAAGDLRTTDQNGDGRADIWRSYDSSGRLTEIDIDSNFDGSPDIREIYQQGVLVRRESDRNFNGQTDLIEEFDPTTHGQTRSVVDTDYDGIADLLVLFRDGRPAFSKRAQSLKRAVFLEKTAAAHHDTAAVALSPLTDPFASDTSIRGTSITSTDEGSVGLSTSGGLPCPRVVALGRLAPSQRLVARYVSPSALALLQPHSSRAPPLS